MDCLEDYRAHLGINQIHFKFRISCDIFHIEFSPKAYPISWAYWCKMVLFTSQCNDCVCFRIDQQASEFVVVVNTGFIDCSNQGHHY